MINDNPINPAVILGSKTAKDGFKNEDYVVFELNDWQSSQLSQLWLTKMGYRIDEIEYVTAKKIKGSYKADIQVVIKVTSAPEDIQNIQVKLVSNPNGFNQIDKRWLVKYQELWNMPDSIVESLKYFTLN